MGFARHPGKRLVAWGTYTPLKAEMRKGVVAELLEKGTGIKGKSAEKFAKKAVMRKLHLQLMEIFRGQSMKQIEVNNDIRVLQHRMKHGDASLGTSQKYANALERAIANDRRALEVVYGLRHEIDVVAEKRFIKIYRKDIENLGNELAKIENYIRRQTEK